MKIITIISFLALPIISFAQNDFKPGFAVKNKGDTLWGYLEQQGEKNLTDKIIYAETLSSAPLTFTINDIITFGYETENTFDKIVYTNPFDVTVNQQFAKILSKGYYSLYTFWKKDTKYFIIKGPQDSCYFLCDDNMASSGFMREEGNFKNKLLFLSLSCGNLKSSIDNMNYSETDFIKYIDKLNKCVSPSTENNIVYKKEKSKLNIYAYAGGMILSKGHEYTGRIIAKITVPSVDKNLSLNFGVNYMAHQTTELVDVLYYGNKKEQTVNKNIFSIPLSMQYYFTKGIIRPYIDAGITLEYFKNDGELTFYGKKINESKFGPAFTAALGIEGNITDRLFIKTDFRYELFVHYPTIGIAYVIK